jgi:carbonic anhydrase
MKTTDCANFGVICKKLGDDDIVQTKELIQEYFKWVDKDLCFQNVDEELRLFPKKYAEPDGGFFVAKADGRVVGCVGYWKWGDGICEMKRLYVTDAYKGRGVGKRLVRLCIEDAGAKGYGRMRLDTLESMEAALGIYRSWGFLEIPEYYNNRSLKPIQTYSRRFIV